MIYIFLTFSLAYLLGSIPSAVIAGKITKGIDIREHGSHNAGATNVFRVLGAKIAIPVFLVDVLKGFLAVYLLSIFSLDDFISWPPVTLKFILGMLAVLGHVFPVFAGFRGGKGVATLLGVVIGIMPYAALSGLGIFILFFVITHYVSVGSIFAGLSFPIFTIFIQHNEDPWIIGFSLFVATLLLFTHRKNIKRLIKGKESKIQFKKNKE